MFAASANSLDFRSPALPARGWRRLYCEHVLPAHLGSDLDFLAP